VTGIDHWRLAPQAGFEPATLRLTEATPLRHQMSACATKMTSPNDFQAVREPSSPAVDHPKRL